MEKQNRFFDKDVSIMPINLKNSLREKGIHYYFD